MERRELSRRTIALCLAGGVGHALFALWLIGFVREGSFWGTNTPESPSGAAFLSVTILGLVLLGGVPFVLFFRYRLLSPFVALFTLFTWAFYGSYQHFEEARATGATPIGLYADSLFGILWFVPLAIVLLVGLVEYLVRSRFDSRPLEAPSD
ncbi:hypothetical protein [Natronorubrum texcoconense]|uniref:Uncharacterized protein n=1 Tax=Natronorubrum texcoconense TaxID=1095776 RepID=A0A1G8T521_9EURY|nr:hypothetical protein [Natronorubrum texcoconense]SDJ36065.1 hypothetical protein SAMN04515672_0308 [Natronorubrum texcoconense]